MNCRFCNKKCKNSNSLTQHEIRCKNNPNRIPFKEKRASNKNKKWIYKDNISKLIPIEQLNEFIENGWKLGMSKSIKRKIVKRDKSTGKASTPEKEIERRQKISNFMKGNEYWKYNKSHGRGKQGRYKNFWCDSSWELAFIVYHLDNNLYIERCKEKRKYIYNSIEKTYIPDFITKDGIIEIKGFETEQWKAKRKYNPDIIVLYENDIKKFLEYAINKYGKNFCEVLYEK